MASWRRWPLGWKVTKTAGAGVWDSSPEEDDLEIGVCRTKWGGPGVFAQGLVGKEEKSAQGRLRTGDASFLCARFVSV